jgi:hypothetical protein
MPAVASVIFLNIRTYSSRWASWRFRQLASARYADAPVVQEGAAPARGREQLVARRVVHAGLRHLALVLQGDGDRVLRKTVDEVGGAVERIDDPQVFGGGGGVARARFLGKDAVSRVGMLQGVDDGRFCGPVDFGDEVAAALGGDAHQVEVEGGAIDDRARFARGLDGRVEHRVHGASGGAKERAVRDRREA